MQLLHALGQPSQFFACDFVVMRITSLDIGAFEAGKAPRGKTAVAGPDVHKLGRDLFRMGA